eukprot:6195361-Pleurochrysis_carterae.AAC.1
MRGLGSRVSIQLDNTCGDNKNLAVIAILDWLVQNDIFVEASFLYLMNGHPFSVLDPSFSELIKRLHAVYTILSLVSLIGPLLACYNDVNLRELLCV